MGKLHSGLILAGCILDGMLLIDTLMSFEEKFRVFKIPFRETVQD